MGVTPVMESHIERLSLTLRHTDLYYMPAIATEN
jgi:hypothetical protein